MLPASPPPPLYITRLAADISRPLPDVPKYIPAPIMSTSAVQTMGIVAHSRITLLSCSFLSYIAGSSVAGR